MAIEKRAPRAKKEKRKVWKCIVCPEIYDEEVGMPEDGIPAGTKWEDVPEDWRCPTCHVGKEDFELVEVDD